MTATVSRRLPTQPGEVLDRRQRLAVTWQGRRYPAYAGDTIASALAAGGVRVFSRSFKYHRPRGIMTASRLDPGCLVQVGDEPNVRAAHRLAEDGMDVRPQGVWPSLRFDLKAANGLVGRFLPPGFYYKTFMAPTRLWPWYERVLQRYAGGGRVPPGRQGPDARFEHRYVHPDVVVAGGGPAGMAAAVAAADAGASVLLIDEDHALGGHLRVGDDADLASLLDLRLQVARTPGIEVLTDAVVFGRYDDNWLGIAQRPRNGDVEERLVKARAGMLIVAAGLVERPYVFAGNDLPGVMLSCGVRRLIRLYAVRPGDRAVVLTANADGDAAVGDLETSGVEVARVEDVRAGGNLLRARGHGRVQAAQVADGTWIDCDLVVTATGWSAPTSLTNMAGDRPVYDPVAARFRPDFERLPPDVMVTGGLAGDGTLDDLVDHGRATGTEAARRATSPATAPRTVATLPVDPHPALFRSLTHGFVDFSEDVTSSDLESAAAEGYDSVELLKRYTTVTMGPMQGKLETVNAVAVLAGATDRTIGEVGTTVWRPPYQPVTLGVLGGPRHGPVRRSPMQPWHEANGAVPLLAGAWVRPDHYGDAQAEARRVRERVGLIDVTPIGKLDLQGPDVPELLQLLYVNKWARLDVGRVRYGAMCTDDGVVFDDGVVGRLADQHWLMTTTSSGAAAVWEWVERWLQTERPDLAVHVTPVTTAFASMNLAGPAARDVLAAVCDDIDLARDAFRYLDVRRGRVADVDGCIVWRIGFTGELSFEVHVPAGYGLHVWEALLGAGEAHGIGPFGVEAQRILRLEKGHTIVGQDTDGLTSALSAGLDWAVKLDKPDFVGKPELAWQRGRDDHPRLVSLALADGEGAPPEASQVLDDGGRIAGRITSSRWSPTLDRPVCLGQVDARLAAPGTRLTVALPNGRRVTATVQDRLAQVDPDGERLRG